VRRFLAQNYGPLAVSAVEYAATTSVARTKSRGGTERQLIVTAPVDIDKRFAVDAIDAPAAIAGRSLGEIAWSRLRRDKWAMAGAIVIILVVLLVIFAPLICNAFGVDPYINYADSHPELLDELGFPAGPFSSASWQHPFGVEPQTGRDLMARTLYGGRNSLIVGVLATAIGLSIGVILGIIAGLRGGWVDSLLSRTMDVLLAFPVLLFAIALLVILGQTTWYNNSLAIQIIVVTFIIGFFAWPYYGRLIRGQVLSLREKEFVDAARSIGAPNSRIIFKELLPNLLPTVLVLATLAIPTNILAEAGLSFLGVGVLPPTPTWGGMINDALGSLQLDPFYMFVPGVAIFIVVLAFNLFGDGLRDATDTRASDL
jgi:peptide/nickel transport system permease protein/oligopeptide transport system permease protein